MKVFQNKKVVIFLGVVVVLCALTAVLMASGALKVKLTATRNKQPAVTQPSTETKDIPLTKMPTQEVKLASRATTFKSSDGKMEFSINLPVGWATVEDDRLDLSAGSITPDKLDDGKTFYANLNANAGKHPSGIESIADYQAKWKDKLLAQYPSMDFLTDYTTNINGMDVYIFEITNTRNDGLILRQIQYVFYVNAEYALVVTGTAPLNTWISHENAIKKSVESVEIIK